MDLDEQFHHTAWQMHHDGHSWSEIGRELGCDATVARAMADRYRRHLDSDAHAAQFPLFEL